MNLKKIANAKNIVCLAVVLALGVGVAVSRNKDGKNVDVKKDSSSSKAAASSVAESSEDKEEKSDREKIILAAEIPELSCGAIDFDGNVVFAEPSGSYSFMENGSSASGISLQDDSGAEIVFMEEDGKLSILRDKQPAAGFVYNKHMITLKDGKLFIDNSPVEYTAANFSAYRLNDEYVLECTAKGKYRLKNSKGEYVNECELKENSGSQLKITADDNGFYSEGVNDGFFYNVYKLNGDLLITSWSNVLYINGQELVPYGYSEKYPDMEAVDADKASLEPMRPPVDYGAVSTQNDGISDLTAEMLGYVNELRVQYDMEPVYGLDELDKASAVRAEELAQNFSHTRPDEKESPYTSALGKAGLSWWHCGENIAKGGESAKDVFDTWISSKDHRAVILDPDMKYLSLANFSDGTDNYWELLMFNDSYVPAAE